MAALAPGDEQPVLTGPDVDEPQTEDSHRRSPPSSIASTIARSRRVRNTASNRSTSSGSSSRGSVRGAPISGTPRRRRIGLRVDNPRGTGLLTTATSSRAIRYENSSDGEMPVGATHVPSRLRDLGSGHHSLPQRDLT
jgi:hypothetical protein